MQRLLLLAGLLCAAGCSSTSESADHARLPEGVDPADLALQGPDGWVYVGVQRDESAPEFVVVGEEARYSIPSAAYERFVPTLGGHVFAVDERGAWWHYAAGERVGEMPWVELLPRGEVNEVDGAWTGAWPVQLREGGCAKVDESGVVLEEFPDAARLELVNGCWVLEDALGSVSVDAPGGDPLVGGVRYHTPTGFVVYLPDDRAIFDPFTRDLQRLGSVPSVRVLATESDRVLMGLVPSFENDPTVALYDYYASETRDRRLSGVSVLHVVEPATSPHVMNGEVPHEWDLVLAESEERGHWTAYELLEGDVPRLEAVLSGTGDREHALRLLQVELISRHSRAVAP